ncbi:MAG: hypothetical protein H0V19_03720, partial [Euzebyales bacterium]|nr:hypothetical protein [Euzebyales bacterium]
MEQRDRRWAGALAAAAAVVAVVHPTGARAAEVPPVSVVDVDVADAPQVTLTAAVRLPPELEGTILPDDAFTVIENGTPRPLQVDRVPERRVEVVILLDTSTALSGEVVDAARSAAVEFILQLPPTARIAVRGTGGHARTGVAFGTGAATAVAA